MAVGDHSGESGAVDHVAAGYRALRCCGVNVDDVLAASLGRNEHGDEQLFVLGGQVVLLMPTDGGGDPDELHRTELRSVEVVPGRGLLLRSPGRRWLHLLPDGDAASLRDAVVEMPLIPPTTGSGHAIPEQNWRGDRLAHLVGLIIMRAAEAEHSLSLVAAYGHAAKHFDRNSFGQSGGALVSKLNEVAKSSPAVADMAERYDAWAKLRNQLVHSIRPLITGGHPGLETHKPIRGGEGDPRYEVATQDLPDLVDLWYAFNGLSFDATKAVMSLWTGMTAADLPLPDSVVRAERVPVAKAAAAE